jgi:signal transduction histidine kinase
VIRSASDLTPALKSRLSWITGLRLLFLLTLFGAMAFFYLRNDFSAYSQSQRIVFATLGVGFGLAAVYAGILRQGKRLQELAYSQITLDQLTWTAIVYVTGGASSGATSLYALSCVLGAVLVGLRGALYAAGAGVLAYAALCAGFVLGMVHPPSDQVGVPYLLSLREVFFPFLLNTIGIVVVAALSGYLADRLRSTRGALDVANLRVKEAEQLALLGKLATGLAHEIRNPLGAISGSIEMLKEAPELSDEDRHLCEIIHRESTRLNQLVTDMMELAKPRQPSPELVDVAQLCRDVVALAARSERSGTGDVRVEFLGPEGSLIAYCDGAQVRQVVWNLVRNAVQASGAGSAVEVRCQTRDGKALLSILDQGPGIPEDARDQIFDAFYTTRTKGAGIGLAVVKRIMDDHAAFGGGIEVLSPESGGARFDITLPTERPVPG